MAFISLPIVTIQHDFDQAIRDVDEGLVPVDKFWVSCYKTGETSVHAKVEVELDGVDRNLIRFAAKEGDVEVAKTNHGYSVASKSLDIHPTTVLLPTQNYTDLERSTPTRPQRITAFDVSPDTTRFATGHLDGSVIIYPSTPPPTTLSSASIPISQAIQSTATRKLVSKSHLSSITSLTFFPSSRVLLTSSADFSLSILSAEFPDSWPDAGTRVQPVRVLRAHTRSVTAACILGLGRTIVSASMDATVRLWDVPEASAVHTLNAAAPVVCATTGTRVLVPPDGEDEDEEGDQPEVGNAVVYAGLQNGAFEMFDLRFKKSVYTSPPTTTKATINAISYIDSQHLLATGASDGVVSLYDVRSLRGSASTTTTPDSQSPMLTSFRRNEAAISDLEFVPSLPARQSTGEVGLAVATRDGLPYVASVIPEGPGVYAELVGVDCDPVQSVCMRSRSGGGVEAWSAGDDAVVRRYIL